MMIISRKITLYARTSPLAVNISYVSDVRLSQTELKISVEPFYNHIMF